MADQKVSDLPSLNGADVDAADLLYIIDSSAGTAGSKKITIGQYQLAPYSAGTANGVMYLNGSNVVTTGSALVFDGTNLGLGVTPSAQGVYRTMQFGDFLNIGQQTTGTSQAFFGWNVRGSSTANQYLYNRTGDKAALYEILSDAAHRWYTAPSGTAGNAISFTQAMTLDASGNLLVGTTNSSVGTAVGFRVVDSGGRLECGSANTANANIGLSMYSTGAAAYRFYVGWGGTIFATSTTISAISDQRLKENVQDLDVGLDKIMALKPRKFDWKPGKGKDIKGDRGWIAQEFEQVFPDMVDQWLDSAPEGEEPYKSVRADLIPVLVKAMQEQQALINDLRARVAALEAQ